MLNCFKQGLYKSQPHTCHEVLGLGEGQPGPGRHDLSRQLSNHRVICKRAVDRVVQDDQLAAKACSAIAPATGTAMRREPVKAMQWAGLSASPGQAPAT